MEAFFAFYITAQAPPAAISSRLFYMCGLKNVAFVVCGGPRYTNKMMLDVSLKIFDVDSWFWFDQKPGRFFHVATFRGFLNRFQVTNILIKCDQLYHRTETFVKFEIAPRSMTMMVRTFGPLSVDVWVWWMVAVLASTISNVKHAMMDI